MHPVAVSSLAVLLSLISNHRCFAEEAPEYGPAKGTLIIIGGGDDRNTGIREAFIHRAGGLGAKLVIVPTAGGNKSSNGEIKTYQEEDVVAPWKRMGFQHVRM